MERSGSISASLPWTLDLPADGGLVVRFVRPSDAGALRSFYADLDVDAVYRRFFTAVLPPPDFFERLAGIEERGGCAVVAVDPATEEIVAEADYEMLENGNGEMALTVHRTWRGWMGPFLLSVLCEVAHERGVPNFEAEILSTNRAMRAITRARGEAILPTSTWQTVRVAFSTHDPAPRFVPGDRPKILVESRSSAFAALAELAAGGYDVMACHGRTPPASCPLQCGAACPLVESADLVILAGPDDEDRRLLVDAHRERHGDTAATALPRTPGRPIDGQALLDAARQYFERVEQS